MPFMSREYGLHPWDFGGERELSEWEASIYRDDAEATIRERRKQARQQARQQRSSRRRR
jgi:hypothetical protein